MTATENKYNENLLEEELEFDDFAEEYFIEEEFPRKERLKKAKRRKATIKHNRKDLKRVITCPHSWRGVHGYVDWDFVDGQFKPVGKYVKYPRNSVNQRDFKRLTSKRNRQIKIDEDSGFSKGNSYRRVFDLKWELD